MLQATTLCKMFPDFDKVSKEMLFAVAGALAGLDSEMVRRVCSPVLGLPAMGRFCPTAYDIHQCVQRFQEYDERYSSARDLGDRVEAKKQAAKEEFLRLKNDPENDPENAAEKRQKFIANLGLEKRFGKPTHGYQKVERVDYDGPATEAAMLPTGSRFKKLPKKFPQHLLETKFIKGEMEQ